LKRILSVSKVNIIRQKAKEFAVELDVLGIYSGKKVTPV